MSKQRLTREDRTMIKCHVAVKAALDHAISMLLEERALAHQVQAAVFGVTGRTRGARLADWLAAVPTDDTCPRYQPAQGRQRHVPQPDRVPFRHQQGRLGVRAERAGRYVLRWATARCDD